MLAIVKELWLGAFTTQLNSASFIDFNNPHEVAISSDGNTFYVAEIGPNRVR